MYDNMRDYNIHTLIKNPLGFASFILTYSPLILTLLLSEVINVINYYRIDGSKLRHVHRKFVLNFA